MTNDIEHFVICSLAMYIFFEECLDLLLMKEIGLFCLFIDELWNSLYILDTSLSDVC